MTILQITSHLDVGGITRYILSLSKRLAARGHRVIIASGGGHCEAELAITGVTHWPVSLKTSSEFSLPVFRAWRQLAARLQAESVDVIHAHTRVAQVTACYLAGRFHLPYVTTWHGIFKRRLGRRLWPCAGDLTIAISEPVRHHLLQDFHIPEARVRRIYNGIDAAWYAIPPDAAAIEAFRQKWNLSSRYPIIGGIGRMASGRVKGFDLILAAAYFLPEVHVLLVGDGPRRPFLEDVAKRLRIADRVHFVGVVDDIRVPLAFMDAFVFSSRWPEGFGLSLIEAMAAGKAVVATRVGATIDIIEHARSGLLVDPENPSAIAEGITRLLQDQSFASRLAAGAQECVRRYFNLDRMADEIEAAYQAAMIGRMRKAAARNAFTH